MDKPQKNDHIDIFIEDIGFEGIGIGKTDGNFAVFIPYTVPGDLVQGIVIKTRKNLAEARLIKIIKPSLSRIDPECAYFGTCNGCKMQHISYLKQLEIKRNNVINAFERIGGFKNINVSNVIGTENIYYYRNKLEFSFSANKWLTDIDIGNKSSDKNFALGFHKPGFIDKVIDINKCLLQSDISNDILNNSREFFKSLDISIYSTKTNEGFLKFLVIRQSANTNDIMINIITSKDDTALMNEYTEFIITNISQHQISPNSFSIIHSVSSRKANVAQADYFKVLYGKGYLEEKLGNYIFKISPFSFFQTNTKQCENLFSTITKLGDFSKNDNIIDLYCGCGAISLYISGLVNSVYGVELSKEAIESANENAAMNNVNNCEFMESDVKDFLKSIISPEQPEHSFRDKYNTVILDPPRSGIHPKAAEYIFKLEPEKIIYVSCNPTTQARDIKLLSEKYSITEIQPVDMFPHTFHIENVARLDLIKKVKSVN